jgi:hypothetical protein
MKKLTSLALMFITTISAFAQGSFARVTTNYQNNVLIINSASLNKDYTITIDRNYVYQSNGTNATVINSLGSGYHQIEITQLKRGVFGKQRREIIYTGSLNMKQGYETSINIGLLGNVNISERQINVIGNNNGTCDNNSNGRGNGKHTRENNKYGDKHDDCDHRKGNKKKSKKGNRDDDDC